MPANPPSESGSWRLGVGDSRRSVSLQRRVLAFALAILLPIVASILTVRIPFLQVLPFALHFSAMVGVAILAGLAPALTSVLIAALSHVYYQDPAHVHWVLSDGDRIRVSMLFASALVVVSMNHRRYRSSERLEGLIDTLQERTDALMQSLHNSKCASWTVDLAPEKQLQWFPGSYQIFGLPFDEIEDFDALARIVVPEDQEHFAAAVAAMRSSGDPVVFEYRVFWPNGEVHWLWCHGTRIPNHDRLWRGVTADVTERKLAEVALLRSEKLAAMGRLASTVAHEINNPLEAVTNLLYLARTEVAHSCSASSPDAVHWLETAEQELARLGHITRLTLGFVRTGALSCTLDLSENIEDVLFIFRHRYEMKEVHIDRDLQPGVAVNLPSHELHQIATNLIANAIDALSEPHARIFVRVHLEPGPETAVLTLEDNGIGIPSHQLSRIFEAFFSTKVDVGTGIGLWVAKELVEKNGGRISVQSGDLENGMKTRFRVEFPLASTSAV